MFLLALWGIYASQLTGKLWDNIFSAYDTVLTFAMTVSLMMICVSYQGSKTAVAKPITILSKNTMGIFILHYPFNAIVRSRLPQLFAPDSPVYTLLGSAIYILFILVVSLALCLALKSLPGIKRLV